MSKRINKIIIPVFVLFYLMFFAVIFFIKDGFPLESPQSFKDILFWFESPSLILPKSNVFNFAYYALFAFFKHLFSNLSLFLKAVNLFCYIAGFAFYLIYCYKRFKNIITVFFASLFYLGIYFLFPGGNFWFFCFNLFFFLVFPQGAFFLMPLLLFNSFALGLVVNLFLLFYMVLSKKVKTLFSVKLALPIIFLGCIYIIFLDYFFYDLNVLSTQDIKFLIWQGGLLGSIFLVSQMFFYLSYNFNGKRLFLIFLIAISFVFGLKTITPLKLIVPVKYAAIDFKEFLKKYDLKKEKIMLLDKSKESLSFFAYSGVDVKNYIFHDSVDVNDNFFEKLMAYDLVSYLIVKENTVSHLFTKGKRDNLLRFENLTYKNVYKGLYNIWQIDVNLSSALQQGEDILQEYRYLPKDLRLGAERMHRKINNNPCDYRALTSLGRIYQDLYDFEQAKKYLRAAIAYKDDYADAYLHLGQTYTVEYATSKQASYLLYFMAKQLYLRGLCFDKENHEYYHLLGDLEEAKGDLKEAVKYSKESLTLSNDQCDPSHYRLALWEIKKGNIEKAKEHLLKAVKNAPSHSGDTPKRYQDLLKTLN